MIKVTVAYANLERQVETSLDVAENCTIALAIQRSGLLQQFPEIALGKAAVGVYGERRALDDLLQEGDRIEIYRPLQKNPQQARLARHKLRSPISARSKCND